MPFPDDVVPGMTMGPHGMHLNRKNTWWKQGAAWMEYLARCQYLLQQGSFVADLCYYYGENAPNTLDVPKNMVPPPPAGHDYDACGAAAVMQMTLRDGRLVLPGGMRYRVLVLPPDNRMRPEVARKISELAKSGATVVGSLPVQSPSLENHPACDAEVRKIAAGLRIAPAGELEAVLAGMKLLPDFEDASGKLKYIHRRIGGKEVYFVSNQRKEAVHANCTFRVAGKAPELWFPESGKTEAAMRYASTPDGRTSVRFNLDPAGSVFVVFDRPADPETAIIKLTRNGEPLESGQPSLEIHRAAYGVLSGTADQQVDVSGQLREKMSGGQLSIVAGNQIAGDPAKKIRKQLRVEYSVDGKRQSTTVEEKETLVLSAKANASRPAELNGSFLTAWEAGRYKLETASGKKRSLKVGALPKPLILDGSWELRFPDGWGAPEKAMLPELASWTEHPHYDIKHFSGTASYIKEFGIPAESLGEDRRVELDLGHVQVIAEVVLNGKELGVLWKAPYAVDVSGAIRPGTNRLEIRVTNLWPNRLIGDAAYPTDQGFVTVDRWIHVDKPTGKRPQLAAIPDWVWGKAPRSESKRRTYTTWNHYKKNSPLLESGLLGPVVIRFGTVREM